MKLIFKLLIFLVVNGMMFFGIKYQAYSVFNVTTLDNPSPGYLFIDPTTFDLSFIDNAGYFVHSNIVNGFYGAYLNSNIQSNGNLTFFFRDAFTNTARFYSINKKYQIVDSFSCTSQYPTDFHDFQILSNGHYLLLGDDLRTIDMSVIVPNGRPNALVRGMVIQEFDAQHNLVWQWNTFDHYLITDATEDINLTDARINYVHCNALFQDTDGNIILSSRHLDEITKINRTTGEIMWRMGGSKCRNNQFTFINDSRDNFVGFSHQHDVQRLSNGHLLLFDNGNLKPNQYSRAVEYEINESSKTVTKVWEYRHTPDVFSISQGNIQRLPTGNSLIGWGENDNNLVVTEFDQSNKTVFEMTGTNFISYRVYRYIYDLPVVTRNISSRSAYNFNDYNNQTHINLSVETLTGVGDVTIEHHNYEAHNEDFKSNSPIEIVPERWVMSSRSVTKIMGKMTFNLDSIGEVSDSSILVVYWRAKEGIGQFEKLTTTYNPQTRLLEAQFKGLGEYILGIPGAEPPDKLLPVNQASSTNIPTFFKWKKLANATSYSIQVSIYSGFYEIAYEKSGLTDTNCTVPDLKNLTKYYWRISALQNGTNTAWSDSWFFTTGLPPPVLTFPFDSSKNIRPQGTVSWAKVSQSTSYKIIISEHSDFSGTNINAVSVSNDYLFKGLGFNKRYFWKVASVNGSTTSEWSQPRTFLTQLDTVHLELPADDSKDLHPKSVLFSWNALNGALNYQLQIANDSAFSDISINYVSLKDTFLIEKNLPFNKDFYWRVSGFNENSIGEWSAMRKFSTAIGPPELLQPSNNAGNINITGYLKWEVIPNVQFYYLQVSTDSIFQNIIIEESQLTGASFKFSDLEYNKQYFWRVLIATNQGNSIWSDIWAFQTRQEFYIEKPVLQFPQPETCNLPLTGTLTWEPTPSAVSYNIELSETNQFENNIVNVTGLVDSAYNYKDLQFNKKYFWRVQAVGSKSISDWSDLGAFYTLLDSPVILNPENSVINAGLKTIFSWSPVDGATDYHLQFARDEGFFIRIDTIVKINEISNVDWLNGFTKYFWRVKAVCGQKESSWSQVWSFTTDRLTSMESNEKEFNYSIIPNPSNEFNSLQILINKADFYTISIFNYQGMLVDRFLDQFLIEGNFIFPMSMSHLSSGNYRIVVSNTKCYSSKDFIIIK